MKRLWAFMGTAVFWASWPALWLYLRFSTRTRVVIISGEQILVARGWLSTGHWALPGGGLHRHENPAQGAVREVLEETGLQIEPDQLHKLSSGSVTDHGLRFRYEAFWVALEQSRPIRPQPFEIIEVAWLPITSLNAGNASHDTVQLLAQWSDQR